MTTPLRYFAGTSTLISAPGIAAFTTDLELGQRLWAKIAAGGSGQDVLDEAVRHGFGRLADLLLIEFDGSSTRVLVRGNHTVEVHDSAGGVISCTGAGVRTWAERLMAGTKSGSVGDQDGPGLPLLFGMVRASGFEWGAEGTATRPELAARMPEPTLRASMGEQVSTESGEVHAFPVEVVVDRHFSEELPAAQPVADVDAEHPLPDEGDAEESVHTEVAGTLGGSAAGAAARSGLAETRTEPADDGYDHLFGSTVYRSVEDAAVRDAVDQFEPLVSIDVSIAEPSGLAPGALGDHDGSTIMASQLAGLQMVSEGPAPSQGNAGPVRAVLELVTGERIELDRGAVIGRRPQADRVAGGAIPRLVTVPSPQQDISRSHVQILLDGDSYVAVDLHSVNGTVVTGLDGRSSTLTSGQQRILCDGDLLDLGDGITATLRAAL